jgi:hypothetical protein
MKEMRAQCEGRIQHKICNEASRTAYSLVRGVQGEGIADSDIAGCFAPSPCFLQSMPCLQESAKAPLSRVQPCVPTMGSPSHMHVASRHKALKALEGLAAPRSSGQNGSRIRMTRREGGAEERPDLCYHASKIEWRHFAAFEEEQGIANKSISSIDPR